MERVHVAYLATKQLLSQIYWSEKHQNESLGTVKWQQIEAMSVTASDFEGYHDFCNSLNEAFVFITLMHKKTIIQIC